MNSLQLSRVNRVVAGANSGTSNFGKPLPQTLLLSDIRTALPGTQPSGGGLVSGYFNAAYTNGLTPGLAGAAYNDLGRWSYIVWIALGVVLGLTWRALTRGADWAIVYFFVAVYTVHLVHRGIPKVSYVVVPLILSPRRASGCR